MYPKFGNQPTIAFILSIRRAVIHEDDLQVPESLRKDTVRAHAQVWFHIIYWNDHRNQIF